MPPLFQVEPHHVDGELAWWLVVARVGPILTTVNRYPPHQRALAEEMCGRLATMLAMFLQHRDELGREADRSAVITGGGGQT